MLAADKGRREARVTQRLVRNRARVTLTLALSLALSLTLPLSLPLSLSSYCVCEPEAGTPLAELRVSVGQLGAGRGVCALLYSFARTLRGERGKMPPIARLVLPDVLPAAA